MKSYRSFLICLILVLACACSVKEDRSVCPMYLNLNFDRQIYDDVLHDSFVNVSARNTYFSQSINIRHYESIGLDIQVPRGTVRASAAFGHEGFNCSGDSLIAKKGCEISPLFLWTEKIVSHDDLYYAEVLPRKQFCRMNIVIVGLMPGEDFEYGLRLRADCNALSVYSAKALEGNYTVFASRKNASGYEILIPRQKEHALLLELVEHDEAVVVLDLGAYMKDCGYDWSEPDLDDLMVIVDYTALTLSLEIQEWNNDRIEVVI